MSSEQKFDRSDYYNNLELYEGKEEQLTGVVSVSFSDLNNVYLDIMVSLTVLENMGINPQKLTPLAVKAKDLIKFWLHTHNANQSSSTAIAN